MYSLTVLILYFSCVFGTMGVARVVRRNLVYGQTMNMGVRTARLIRNEAWALHNLLEALKRTRRHASSNFQCTFDLTLAVS
ncbi:uncharacterized protein F5891DRAFT_1060040 [Suillus fuscotomentosus]|uniref:Uncharacterized protein n=1 Tax=Suillus fuscotomentosus TaxID=1912939 RepID=A0AAD4DWR6_9AGAM|nr:uncharacterized protein F5891DRAFT_1060040 [Suillus fuscotomentosus]KAG1895052.1 hypothetical protein F5891DRAFT_1060040 [Suillus fuscotomentosus]